MIDFDQLIYLRAQRSLSIRQWKRDVDFAP